MAVLEARANAFSLHRTEYKLTNKLSHKIPTVDRAVAPTHSASPLSGSQRNAETGAIDPHYATELEFRGFCNCPGEEERGYTAFLCYRRLNSSADCSIGASPLFFHAGLGLQILDIRSGKNIFHCPEGVA